MSYAALQRASALMVALQSLSCEPQLHMPDRGTDPFQTQLYESKQLSIRNIIVAVGVIGELLARQTFIILLHVIIH
jgi:hypothetical protein